MPQTREHLTLTKQLGLKHLVIFINKCDAADEEMIELVEMEVRELLDEMGYSEEASPIVKGSALAALEGTHPELGEAAINQLMEVVDTTIPTPERDLEVPFLVPIDHVHNIPGRGCVITGRMERGKLKVGTRLVSIQVVVIRILCRLGRMWRCWVIIRTPREKLPASRCSTRYWRKRTPGIRWGCWPGASSSRTSGGGCV